MLTWFKSLQPSTRRFAYKVLALLVLVTVLSWPYFTKHIFEVNNMTYSFDCKQGNIITYHSSSGPPIQVQQNGMDRIVTIQATDYVITRQDKGGIKEYRLTYPTGKVYTVQNTARDFLLYDDQGEPVYATITAYSNGERILGSNEELYLPVTLVQAAYSNYHFTRDYSFILAVLRL